MQTYENWPDVCAGSRSYEFINVENVKATMGRLQEWTENELGRLKHSFLLASSYCDQNNTKHKINILLHIIFYSNKLIF